MVESLFCAEREDDVNDLLVVTGISTKRTSSMLFLDSSWDIGVTVDTDYWEYWSARR